MNEYTIIKVTKLKDMDQHTRYRDTGLMSVFWK